MGEDGPLLATPVAVIAGLVYNFLPFMVLPLYASLRRSTTACRGQRRPNTPRRPAGSGRSPSPSTPGLVAGTLLTFIPAAGDYINAQLLGSTNQRMVGGVIQDLFTDSSDYPRRGLS